MSWPRIGAAVALLLVLEVGMVLAFVLGFLAVLRRDSAAHRVWMARS